MKNTFKQQNYLQATASVACVVVVRRARRRMKHAGV